MAFVMCISACGTAWAACYAAAGLIAGTITAGVGAPAAALACNAAESVCMKGCVANGVVEVTTTPWGWLLAPGLLALAGLVVLARRRGN
jgi:hypothetical protein